MSTIRQMLETALAAMVPAVAIVYENTTVKPTGDIPYQICNLMLATPQNPTLPGGFHRDVGYLQVTLMYPQGAGPGNADARAQLIRAAFPRKTTFTSGLTTLVVSGTPVILPGRIDGDRWSVPVKIPFFANVFE